MFEHRRSGCGLVVGAALAVFGLVSSAAGQVPTPGEQGRLHALLINGGRDPSSNYLSHLQHLQRMVDVLRRRGVPAERIHVFSADGEDPGADLATRSSAPKDFWLIEETSLGRTLKPSVELVDTAWRGARLQPARLESLRAWFERAGLEIPAGDRLLIFVTDHGGQARKGAGSGTISLWREDLTVTDFRGLLDRLQPRVQVVTVMSQCYSGAFADLMYERTGSEPSGSTCGFFSTSARNKAYGCYPESREDDRVGYAFEMIDALARHSTVSHAHAQAVQSDSTPDMPRKTSDVYLAKLVASEASARRMDVDELADEWLDRAWRQPAAWAAEITQLDALASSFGIQSPRTLVALRAHEDEIGIQGEQLKAYADRWKVALGPVGESVIAAFLAAEPDWAPVLETKRLEALPPHERTALLTQLLDELVAFARQSAAWPDLDTFQRAASQGAAASYRFEVRKAALGRMRTILMTMAGRGLLANAGATPRASSAEGDTRAAERQALDALLRCEAMALGSVPGSAPPAMTASRKPFPSLKDETALLDGITPSFLGVRYGTVASALAQANPKLPSGTQVQYVEEGSAAADAGFQIGDVLLGPPDRPFRSARDIRNWTTTTPRDRAVAFRLYRPGVDGQPGRELDTVVHLRPYPGERIGGGTAPRLGSAAPILPTALKSGRDGELPDLRGRSHLLFFWATWCGICKAAVPEVMAFAESKGLAVLAITDEDRATVSKFLGLHTQPFFDHIALDGSRRSFVSHGVNATPVTVLVDEKGVIRYRQVGYGKDGLRYKGWEWRRP